MTYDLRTISIGKHLRAIGAFLLGALFAFQVNAQSPYGYPFTVDGNTITYTSDNLSFANNPSSTIANTSNGPLTVQRNAAITLPANRTLPVVIKATPAALNVAKAVGNMALKWTGVLGVGVALYDLCIEMGYPCSITSGQPVTFQRVDSSICTTAPCNEWRLSAQSATGAWANTKTGACANWAIAYNARLTNDRWSNMYEQSNACYGTLTRTGSGAGTFNNIQVATISESRTVAAATTNRVASTLTEFENAIAAKSGWPTNSAAPRALRDAVNAGETVALPAPSSVTGPATVAGPTATTSTPAQNGQPATTTTTSTTYNNTYGPNTVTTNTTNVTTVNNGTTITTTTETKEPEKLDPCKENPDSNACRDDEFDTPSGEVPKTSKTITFQAENLGFAGGSCPADKVLTFHGMAAPVKVFNWVDTCDKVTTYAKPMILALATFAALMIIFGARTE